MPFVMKSLSRLRIISGELSGKAVCNRNPRPKTYGNMGQAQRIDDETVTEMLQPVIHPRVPIAERYIVQNNMVKRYAVLHCNGAEVSNKKLIR